MKTAYMDKKTTTAIKGIALVFMFIHHFFTFPEWYVGGVSYPELSVFAEVFNNPLKICVSIFGFLTGYFYAASKEKTFRYSLRKIIDFLASYWTVYLLLLAIALLSGCYEFRINRFVYELFAIDRPVMIFCWYVHFYCTTMLVLPLLEKAGGKSLFEDTCKMLLLPTVVFFILLQNLSNSILCELLSALYEWFPCIASGYLCSKYALFHRTFDRLVEYCSNKKVKSFKKWFLLILMAAVAFFGRDISATLILSDLSIQWPMDIFYAAAFVYAMAKILQYVKETAFFRILEEIGRQSALMWFLHCAFFNVSSIKMQEILYWPHNPVLVLLNGLLLCYLAARIIDIFLKHFLKLRKRLLPL